MTSAEHNEMTKLINELLRMPGVKHNVAGRVYEHAYKTGDLDALRCFANFPQYFNRPTIVERTVKVLRRAGVVEVASILSEEHLQANILIIRMLSESQIELTNNEYNTIVPLATLDWENTEVLADLWINRGIRDRDELMRLVSESLTVERPLISGIL